MRQKNSAGIICHWHIANHIILMALIFNMFQKSRRSCEENVPTSLLESGKRRCSPEECNKIFREGPVNHQRKQRENFPDEIQIFIDLRIMFQF